MKKNFIKKPVLLLTAAIVLLLASAAGSTQAALTYYSENYNAEVSVSELDVTLQTVDSQNQVVQAQQLELAGNADLIPGKTYEKDYSVKNSGAIDAYIRVIVTKSWKDATGKKDSQLTPAYIEIKVPENNGWIKDKAASTAEREVYYYENVLPASSEESVLVIDSFRVNPVIAKELIQKTNGNEVSYAYKYAGYKCAVDVEVDAVQTHNAVDAIKSAWGVDVAVASNGKLSLK